MDCAERLTRADWRKRGDRERYQDADVASDSRRGWAMWRPLDTKCIENGRNELRVGDEVIRQVSD
jgi:hypothetical protein